ncbi:MAG: polymerase alpha subunit [Devosia sp.]|uniref:error-prone DNA polymerase n=1 Tax=Devosia sp. TaxID=1871048 RepID=UPI002610608E|nr:error-prone DNA polymerase [Devosia sp.]MDB5542030.1 polymerase alpha subunit [Devosia sp.]
MSAPYAELMVTSNFSFLRSGSHPEELVAAAMALGLSGVGIADRNSFAGVVRGYVAHRDMKEKAPDFRYVVGVRLCFADGTPDIVAYPSDREAYGRLCRLLSRGNLRTESEKGNCRINFADLEDFHEGQLFILHCDEKRLDHSKAVLDRLARLAAGRVWLAAACTFKGTDRARLNRLAQMAGEARVPLIAVNDVLYHEPNRKIVQDVVTCIREHLTLETAGRRLEQNAERHLKPPREMARLFAEHPQALAETQELLARIEFTLDHLKYIYPTETIGNGETAQETLERLTWEGAKKRYPGGISEKVETGLHTELRLIAELKYASYFLTVQDVVRYARDERGILCQGRGSAANSAVCYCLGITEVNPDKVNLVFGRFLSTERNEPPDIDVDFEHERREEVMQYVYNKYGGARTGLTATVISYRSKSAIRETAKVFGISDDIIAALNQLHWGWGSAADLKGVKMVGIDPDDPTLTQMFNVVVVLKSFPRHLSQHVGGFVITRDSLESLVPISKTAMESRTIIEWDKDDIDALGILKVDILALGMLTCLRRSFELLHQHYGRDLKLSDLMAEEAKPEIKAPVYRMTHRADTIGVFQIESRAQMSMLPRLKPVEFYDLVIEVAIVRPGPIQGGMVHPYLQRRQNKEKVTFPKPELEAVLGRTLGVPLFQEQAMQIAIVGAGFSAGKADQLRRAMAAWKRNGRLAQFADEFISGMIANGYPEDFAKRCFSQIQGFGEYGFPESHAASFALLVYASCWFKCHYPDVFACALLNSQPMGFYSPAQIVRDAIEHGVEMRPADVNRSDWLHVLEPGFPARERIAKQHAEMRDDIFSTSAIRLGLRQVVGLKQDHANLIVARRGAGYASIRDLWVKTGLPVATLEKLAEADAFSSLGLSRREALWVVRGLNGSTGAEQLPLFASAQRKSQPDDAEIDLPLMPAGESVVHDYRTLSLSLKGHPVGFLRPELDRRGILRCADLIERPNGAIVETAGLVLVRQQPGTASGVIFMTLEDETGIANIIVWPKTFQANRKIVLGSRLMAIRGQLQREGLVTHLVSRTFTDFTPRLIELAQGFDLGDGALARGDEGRSGQPQGRDEGERRRREQLSREAHAALPSGRNFH